jgi:hypothetical protein
MERQTMNTDSDLHALALAEFDRWRRSKCFTIPYAAPMRRPWTAGFEFALNPPPPDEDDAEADDYDDSDAL